MEEKRREKGRGVGKSDVENEELELYKERLKEMETAFRYNLNLLADRDTELDVMEEQLRNGIVQIERLSREKADCEEAIRHLRDEKAKETGMLKKRLNERENSIKELERRNDGNLRTLKNALEDLKREQEEDKQGAEKKFIRMVQLKESEHLEELRKVWIKHAKELDELARERKRFVAESRNLRMKLTEVEQRERSLIARVQHLKTTCRRAKEPTAGTESRGTMTECTVAHVGTQISNGDDMKLTVLREQNDVLKRIIKNLKRKMEQRGVEEKGCGECTFVKEKIEETNRKLEAEIMQVKKEVERERSEEEAVIQSLERSVSCLKDKLLKSLAAGDNVFLLEDKLDRKLEKIDKKVEEVRRKVDICPSAMNVKKIGRNKCP